jgi:Fe-S cluster assembly protein SufD
MSVTFVSPALEKFEELDWPVRTDENWRFRLLERGLIFRARDLSELERQVIFPSPSRVSIGLFSPTVISFQVRLMAAELVEGSFGPTSRLGSSKHAALHAAKSKHTLHIRSGTDLSLELIYFVSGEGLFLPGVVIEAEAGANIRVVKRFISIDDSAAVVVTATDVRTAENSKITCLVTQELNRNSKLIRFSDSTLEASSNAKLAVVHTGAKWVREETYSTVSGSDAKSEILSVTLPDTGQEYDQRTFQHHGARNTFSDLLFKNTLFGKATTIFSGLIFVDEGAHGTDAYQTCRNLMMTDECEAHSMPGLEINADDVKCSHGSTSSRVSDEEIFYLMARGITAKDARGLVAQGFSIEAIERLEDEQLETLAVEVVARKFAIVE